MCSLIDKTQERILEVSPLWSCCFGTHLEKLQAEIDRSSISPGNTEIHRVILLVYLTIVGSFPDNKLHSVEIWGFYFCPTTTP